MAFFNQFFFKRTTLLFFVQLSLIFLFFFRPGIALRMNGVFDEPCYLAWTNWLMGDFSVGCDGKQHFGGIAVLWLPFAFLGKCFAYLTHTDTNESTIFFIGLSSFLYLALSVILLYRIAVEVLGSEKNGFSGLLPWASFLFICSSPVIYYATVRTLLPHAAEIFLASTLILLGVKRRVYGAAGVAFLLCLTRPQNIGCLVYVMTLFELGTVRRKLFQGLGLLLFVGLIFSLSRTGYHQTFLLPSLMQVSFKKIVLFVLQVDFGILWTQFFWVVAFVVGLIIKNPTPSQMGVWSWLFLSALSCIIWPTNGSSYGFRYLIGSYAAAWLLILELLARDQFRKSVQVGLALASAWNLALIWVFPAPRPLWPWARPSELSIGWPFGIVEAWVKNPSAFFSMVKFSPWGMLCEASHYCSIVDFQFMNKTLEYHLSGPLRSLLEGISFTVVLVAVSALSILGKKTKLAKKPHKADPA